MFCYSPEKHEQTGHRKNTNYRHSLVSALLSSFSFIGVAFSSHSAPPRCSVDLFLEFQRKRARKQAWKRTFNAPHIAASRAVDKGRKIDALPFGRFGIWSHCSLFSLTKNNTQILLFQPFVLFSLPSFLLISVHSIHPSISSHSIHSPTPFSPDTPMVFWPVPNFSTTFFFLIFIPRYISLKIPSIHHNAGTKTHPDLQDRLLSFFFLFLLFLHPLFSSLLLLFLLLILNLFDPSQSLRNNESRTHRSNPHPISLHCFVRPRTSPIFAHTSIPIPHPPYFASARQKSFHSPTHWRPHLEERSLDLSNHCSTHLNNTAAKT